MSCAAANAARPPPTPPPANPAGRAGGPRSAPHGNCRLTATLAWPGKSSRICLPVRCGVRGVDSPTNRDATNLWGRSFRHLFKDACRAARNLRDSSATRQEGRQEVDEATFRIAPLSLVISPLFGEQLRQRFDKLRRLRGVRPQHRQRWRGPPVTSQSAWARRLSEVIMAGKSRNTVHRWEGRSG